MIVNITDTELKTCEDFANKIDTEHYSSRGQTDEKKKSRDQIVGKVAEIAAHNYLKLKGIETNYPDFQIYTAKKKSWDFDLKASNYNIHIKAQDVIQAKKYGYSWIFQHGNGKGYGYDKEIFDQVSPNQYVIFVSVDLFEKIAEIKAACSLTFLHEKELFDLPKVWQLQSNKKAVYLDAISKYPEEMFKL